MDVYKIDNATFLGLTISHDLTWDTHVENIVKKAGKKLYMLYQLQRAGISQRGHSICNGCETCTGICMPCITYQFAELLI